MDTLTTAKSVYHAFGLNIASAIPFLDMSREEGSPDVIIQYGKVPDGITDAKIKGVRYQAGPGEFLLQVDNIARYYVTNGNHVLIEREEKAADEEVLLFLMGSAMGALLHQRNILPLHASAIEMDGEGLYRIRLDQDFEKYFTPFDNAGNSPVPLRSVFVLETTNTDQFELVPFKRGDKIDPIINNTYRPRFLEGLGDKKEHFKQCAAVAAKAVVIRIARPGKGFRLDELTVSGKSERGRHLYHPQPVGCGHLLCPSLGLGL